MFTRDVSQHSITTHEPAAVMRSPSPFFAPPVPAYMREPGTNWFSIITADGGHHLVQGR